MTHRELIEQYLVEGRTISGGKGDSEAKAAQKRNEARQDQAFNAQMKQLDFLNKNLSSYLSGKGQGFDPTQLALMKTQFLGQNANDFSQARAGLTSALAARGEGGGQVPMGGSGVRGLSGLFGAQAQSVSGGLNNIDLMNLQQALTNKFNAASVLSGNAATLSSPISTFGAGANNALNQYVYAKNQGFGNAFTSGFGGALGTGLGKGLVGGIGNMFPSTGGGG